MNNAQYNDRAECQVHSLSNGNSASVLRELHVKTINFIYKSKDGMTINYNAEVPADGQKWVKSGDRPNADDVRNGLLNAVGQTPQSASHQAGVTVYARHLGDPHGPLHLPPLWY